MKPEVKKLILSNLPYLIFVYLFGKLGQAYRLAAGVDLSEKLLHFMDGCSAAFANAAPSIHPFDLLIGVAGAAALRLMVYFKGKNAKKYRKGAEYGSARWGTAKDIAPYIDFAKEAGSSPETVRKAIRELQQQGVVEKTRRGYFVTSDKAAVITFRQQYLASVEKEYHNAKEKVEI